MKIKNEHLLSKVTTSVPLLSVYSINGLHPCSLIHYSKIRIEVLTSLTLGSFSYDDRLEDRAQVSGRTLGQYPGVYCGLPERLAF